MLTRRQLIIGGATVALAASSFGAFAAGRKVKVAGIYTCPIEQQWVGRIHVACAAAQKAGEIEYAYSENVQNPDIERAMREYADKGFELVIVDAFGVEGVARKCSRDYPKTAFLLGSSQKPSKKWPNVGVVDNYIQDAAYLTGMIAAGLTKTGKIGMVGGYPIPEVNRLMNAFIDGALAVNPKIGFMISFINNWYDPPKAKEASFAMIDKGADIMYAERFGVSDAAKERKILAIGNVIDTSAAYPDTIAASALWDFAPTLRAACAAVAAGKFKDEAYGRFSHMKEGGCSLAPLGKFESRIPADVLKRVRELEAKMKAGTFAAKINDAQPKSTI